MDPRVMLGYKHMPPAAKRMPKGFDAGVDEFFEYHGFVLFVYRFVRDVSNPEGMKGLLI
jgi:hypothetical protein